MPIPDALGKIRSSLGALAGHADGVAEAYARATPKRAEITEKYFVRQELSKNRSMDWGEEPSGRIDIEVPFDGYTCFPRSARDDVARRAGGQAGDVPQTAVIGHLLLHDHEKTNLRSGLHLHDRNGAVPVEVPIPDLDELTADRRSCVIEHEFQPQLDDIFPAQLSIDIYDPDSLELPTVSLLDLPGTSGGLVSEVIRQIRRQANFRNELLLHIRVSVTLPIKPGQAELSPSLARVSIDWPTITSLQTLRLLVGGDDPEEVPVRYNPVGRCLEWEKIRMFPADAPRPKEEEASRRRYQSAEMLLFVGHPGELYAKDEIEVHADVEVPGYLLSGLEARLYDATGHKQRLQPKLTTHIHADARLMLSDAFAKRTFSPFQHLFFAEIVPSDDRIDDIITVLHDAGFQETKKLSAYRDEKSGNATWLLAARRRQGADPMELWILVEGRRFTVERITRMDDLGYRAQVDTGALQVFMRGALARDHSELTRAMNSLQQTLRERFARFHVRA